MTVEPVVVIPEVDSNKASVNLGIVRLKIKGRVPNNENITHDSATDRNPSLIFIFLTGLFFIMRKNADDNDIVIIAGQTKGRGDS